MNDYKVRCDASNPDNVELMIYGTIGDTAWWDDVVDKNIAEILNRNKAAKQITVRINSLGGYAHSGIAIYNALQQHPGKVVTIVEGLAASAASIVAMAGETRMLPGSMLMIHNPWTFASGEPLVTPTTCGRPLTCSTPSVMPASRSTSSRQARAKTTSRAC